MIEYLLSLLFGFTVGFLIENSEAKWKKDLLSKGMTASLFLLIFFLGFDIGARLNLQEMFQVGKLSVVFAVTSMSLSYLITKILVRGLRCL